MKYLFLALSIIMILMGCSQSETIVASNEDGEKERNMLIPGETFSVADFYILSETVLDLVLKNNTEEYLRFYLDYSVKCDSSAHASYFSSVLIVLSAFGTETDRIYLPRQQKKSTVCNLEMTSVRASDSEKFNTWTGTFRITTAKF